MLRNPAKSDAHTEANIGAILRAGAAKLEAAGKESAALDARVLLAHALGVDPSHLIGAANESVTNESRARFNSFTARRAAGEPVARIIGAREFWSRAFALSPQTLVPRPESETLVEAALEAMPDRDTPLRILDLGTGSGCLLAALLLEYPAARGVGVDADFNASQAARDNLLSLGISNRAHVLCGDWASAIDSRFDLVVSNPPYIPSDDIPGLAPEVRQHDPHRALDGGADGLESYRRIIGELHRLLTPRGTAVLELGAGQEQAVANLARHAHLSVNGPARADLSGYPRALVLDAQA